MSTTVRVGKEVHEKLDALKQEKNLSSYEEVLEELLENEAKKVSLFGADEELESWNEEDRSSFRSEEE
jgi:predicted CopG family antitoxin